MARLRLHERATVEEDAFRRIHALTHLLARLTMASQQLEPYLVEHVRVHVDHGHDVFLPALVVIAARPHASMALCRVTSHAEGMRCGTDAAISRRNSWRRDG